MLLYVLLALAAVVVLLLVMVALQPAEFHVERSITIAAPPEKVFRQVNNLHHWEAWSPWAKRDPQMVTTYDGPPEGVNSVYTWNGNNQVGQGKTTIVESRPHELVRIRLEMLKPFKATNDVRFSFRGDGAGTKVTWRMDGTHQFIGKAMGLVMNMDKMIGSDFEKGLGGMKSVVEQAAG